MITCKDCDKLFNLDGVKLKTVPFQSKLLDRMELKDFDKQSFNQFDNYYDYMDQLSISGESFSVLEDINIFPVHLLEFLLDGTLPLMNISM